MGILTKIQSQFVSYLNSSDTIYWSTWSSHLVRPASCESLSTYDLSMFYFYSIVDWSPRWLSFLINAFGDDLVPDGYQSMHKWHVSGPDLHQGRTHVLTCIVYTYEALLHLGHKMLESVIEFHKRH